MVTDEMVFAAAEAGRQEMKAWAIVPSPIIGVDKVTLHDAHRQREFPVGQDTLPLDTMYMVYECDNRAQAREIITGKAWHAGLEAALKIEAQGATKQ